jgi:hypothetical protein
VRQMREPRGACPRTTGSRRDEQPAAADRTPTLPDLRHADGPRSFPPRWTVGLLLRDGLSLVRRLPPHHSPRSNLPVLALRALYQDRSTHAPFPASDPERPALPALRRTPERRSRAAIETVSAAEAQMQTRTYDETKWKLVPLEPTKRQMDVARPLIRLGNMEEVRDIYIAMVAAAEEPPQEA